MNNLEVSKKYLNDRNAKTDWKLFGQAFTKLFDR